MNIDRLIEAPVATDILAVLLQRALQDTAAHAHH